MNAAGRLATYGAGLALLFGGGLVAGNVIIPDSTVAAWQQTAQAGSHSGGSGHSSTSSSTGTADPIRGLSLAQDGFVLSPVEAPTTVGTAATLSFQIRTADGLPFTDFATSHEKDLHLIVVRTDGTQFRHVHPTLDAATGTWSVPWTWAAAGTYRVFADFVPANVADAPNVTLTRTLDVAGNLKPEPATAVKRQSSVDGYDVTLTGDLKAGESTELTVEVSKDGKPVTQLQPYLGAFGHLVALRSGDLAYLHVHAEGDEPTEGQTAGPTITFATQAPTAGRYLLYLDFQVGGKVRTATFVLDATAAAAGTGTGSTDPSASPNPHENMDMGNG